MKNNFYSLEKSLWTNADFNKMAWHDVSIHAMAIEKNDGAKSWAHSFVFDIDYIFEWKLSGKPSGVWVAPCTLVFKNVLYPVMKINMEGFSLDTWDIDEITMTKHESNDNFFDWTIKLHQGEIRFSASGYEQIVRKHPMFVEGLSLPQSMRGGISFERIECET